MKPKQKKGEKSVYHVDNHRTQSICRSKDSQQYLVVLLFSLLAVVCGYLEGYIRVCFSPFLYIIIIRQSFG